MGATRLRLLLTIDIAIIIDLYYLVLRYRNRSWRFNKAVISLSVEVKNV
jgi:hypothetical protein